MRRTLVIVQLTLFEALRRRVLVAALIGGMAFLLLYAIGYYFVAKDLARQAMIERRMMLSLFTLAGLYAVNLLTVMSAVLLPVDTLSGEVGSGAIQTIAVKPIRRAEIVIGKWLAYVLAVGVYFTMMAGGVLLVARVFGAFTPPNLATGLPLMLLEAALLVSVSIAGGASWSTVTNGMAAFGLYGLAFIGNWVEQIGTFTDNVAARNVGTVASLLMPAEALWQRAAWHMQPAIMRDLHASPFSPASVPSAATVWWAAGYAVCAVVIAARIFGRRAL